MWPSLLHRAAVNKVPQPHIAADNTFFIWLMTGLLAIKIVIKSNAILFTILHEKLLHYHLQY